LEVALLPENERRCLPPLPEREVQAIARSMVNYPPRVNLPGNDGNSSTEARLPGRPWLTILRDVAQALAEARSSGFVSINNMPVETKRNREVRAADLQAQAKEEGRALRYLPLLGREGYIVRGFTHLISGYAKAGKTQLLAQVVGEWREEPILWFTEEPQAVWEARLARLPDVYHHVTLYFALGCPRQELLERIAEGQETVVIVDTTKLLGITDPDHAGEVTAVLGPLIASCREAGKTLILVHHERKEGVSTGRVSPAPTPSWRWWTSPWRFYGTTSPPGAASS
jgi:hypothetical protein